MRSTSSALSSAITPILLVSGLAGVGVLIAAGSLRAVLAGALVLAIASAARLGLTGADVARVAVWIGLLGINAVTQQQTEANVAQANVNGLAVIQIALPVAALAAVLLLDWQPFFPLNRRECLLAGYLTLALLSSLWSVAPKVTALKAIQLIIAYALVLAMVRRNSRQQLVAQVVVVVQVIVIASLLGAVIHPGAALVSRDVSNPTQRLHGLFPAIGPDLLGLVAAVALISALLRSGSSLYRRGIARWGFVALDVGCLLLTRSRTSLLLTALGLFVGCIVDPKRRVKMLVFILPLALAILVPLASSSAIVNFVHRGQNQVAFSTLTGRTQIWSAALHYAEVRPLEGYGYYAGHRVGAFAESFSFELPNIDNMWLETFLDVGIFGVILLTGLVVGGVVALLQDAEKEGGGQPSLFVPTAAICIVSSIVNPSLQQPNYPMYLFGLALLARPAVGMAVGSRALALHRSRVEPE